MNTEALRQLRRVVEGAPDDRFDMRDFKTEKSCGTAHCAAGWAQHDLWFRAHGFVLSGIFDESNPQATFRYLSAYFGLSAEDTESLFGGNLSLDDKPPEKDAVIANIDLLLNGDAAIPYDTEDDD